MPADYVQISSGLGEATPLNIVVLPVLFEGEVKAVIELASFHRFSDIHLTFLDQLTESIGIVLNTIAATMRTEELLKQSQSLADELQTRQQELTETNARLEQQARTLQAVRGAPQAAAGGAAADQRGARGEGRAAGRSRTCEVESKNREVEQARTSLEEKAEQLALTSKYKSEFLANMSHELRTPLNSLLILSKLLSQNPDGNLTDKQVEFAKTIHSSGTDLLELINEILDLSKIESGTMDVDVAAGAASASCRTYVERDVPPGRADQGAAVRRRARAGPAAVDRHRPEAAAAGAEEPALQRVQVHRARAGRACRSRSRPAAGAPTRPRSTARERVIAFRVTDTGIGIPADKQRIIFEAFQQADGTTSRKYGGTGLGLSISREIARLLGGEIRSTSEPGSGSTFTLYLPETLRSRGRGRRRRARGGPRDRGARGGGASSAGDRHRRVAARRQRRRATIAHSLAARRPRRS